MRNVQKVLCYFMAWILFLTGFYATYIRAESFAERAASMEAARMYASETNGEIMTQLAGYRNEPVQADVCMVEDMDSSVRAVIGRVTSRSSLMRRDLRVAYLFLCVLCIAFFNLRCRRIEEKLCLSEKKYRTALIKYIHDMDGKKREACLI